MGRSRTANADVPGPVQDSKEERGIGSQCTQFDSAEHLIQTGNSGGETEKMAQVGISSGTSKSKQRQGYLHLANKKWSVFNTVVVQRNHEKGENFGRTHVLESKITSKN